MRNLVLLSVITSTIACQEQDNTVTTSEATQQRLELEPNLTKMTDSFQQYVGHQSNDFTFTQSRLSELQPDGPECLFAGEVQGQVDMSQAVPAWHLDLSDDQGVVVQELEPLIMLTSSSFEDRQMSLRLGEQVHPFNVEQDVGITLRFEVVEVEIDLSISDDQKTITGEWVICPVQL